MTRRVTRKPDFSNSKLRYSRTARVYNDTIRLIEAIASSLRDKGEAAMGMVPHVAPPEIIHRAVREMATRLGIDPDAAVKGPTP